MTTIATNIARVREVIAAACTRSQRQISSVCLIAVSKTQSVEAILQAAAAGVQHFGENRVEESESKIPKVNAQSSSALIWHMVGHIQSRKAKEVLPLFPWVHSIDSLKLAGKLAGLATEQGKRLDVLLEVNVSGEAAKHGFQAAGWKQNAGIRQQLWDEFQQAARLPGLNVCGLMTMAPIVEDAELARPVFRSLAELRAAFAEASGMTFPELSMGMTDDYPIAIEEGATMVRVGRAIFGERQT